MFQLQTFRNPNSDEVPEWPSYDSREEQYVIIDTPFKKGAHLKSGATDLLNRILTKGNPGARHDEL